MSENNEGPQDSPEELKAKIAQLEADKNSLTGELTTNRPKLRDKDDQIALLQDQLRAATEKNATAPTDEERLAAVVEGVLSRKEQDKAKDNKKAAFEKFVNANKDYHPENDASGLKLAALENKFNRFNIQGLVEVDDFLSVIGEANALLRGNDTTRQTADGTNPYSSTSQSAIPPKEAPDNELTSQEVKLIERNNWTKEKYLQLKAKMPDFIEGLVEKVR